MITVYKTSSKGIELIKHYESLHDGDLTQIGLQPKMCPAGIWTIGWGHAIIHNGQWLKEQGSKELAYELFPSMSIEQAERLLKTDLQVMEARLNSKKMDLTQNQFDALISFIFNCGFSSFQGSTLLRRITTRTGSIPEAFAMWNKCKGKVLLGLTLRRAAESKLYLS